MNLRRATELSAPPLSLPQVLEEEYARLHGPLPNDYPQQGSNDIRLAAINRLIHNLPHQRMALCLSGGGIRSATFGLGVIQGLAKLKLLERFDYLSTVSGGGYIGSWFSAWIRNHLQGLAGVVEELRRDPPSPQQVEPESIVYLRAYSNYLSPRLGLLSADSWTLVGTYLRNLILNWLVFLPFLLALLAIPHLYRALLDVEPTSGIVGALTALGTLLLFMSLTYMHLCRPSLWKLRSSPGWKGFESQSAFLSLCLTPLLAGVTCLTMVWQWQRPLEHTLEGLTVFGLSSLTTLALGASSLHTAAWVLAALILRRPWADMWRYLELQTIILSGALGGGLLWLTLKKVATFSSYSIYEDWYTCGAVPAFLSLFLLAATLFVGIASRFTGDGDREWWGRSGSWVLIGTVSWMGASSIAIFGPWLVWKLPGWIASAGGVTGLFTLLFGFSAKTAAMPSDGESVWWKQLGMKCYLLLLAPLTVILILVALATGNTAILGRATPFEVTEFIVGMALFSVLMSYFVNINKFSLHAMYRNRLIRAYLGASRGARRTPNPFTGFDVNDNFQMYELASEGKPIQKPLHVVNMALNLVHGGNLAWQQRKAQSFTVSPLHSGSASAKPFYRPTKNYGKNPAVGQAITIGTALAISGAAASPNMGYHSSPAVTFLLALFNIRLGWWLGNPGEAGQTTYTRSCPEFALGPLLTEAFGLTDDEKRYIYLSDGGHFENLALYEMIRRRCHVIIVSDAGCDQQSGFSDLGNAIRKIRIDLGIEIELDVEKVRRKEGTSKSERHHAIGTIRYDLVDPNAPKGILLYLKPTLTGQEPVDILEYANYHKDFPHESTGDQFFDESQFESYRKLGAHIIDEVFHETISYLNHGERRLFEELCARWSR